MADIFHDGRVILYPGDCLDVLKTLPDNSIDSCVTDPPYGLQFMGKAWDRIGDSSANYTNLGTPHASQASFPMNKTRGRPISETDGPAQQRWHEAWAREVYRVLKPGAYLLAFGGTRTYHRMACAIEDAGFEIRDQIQWLYGTGFPKSHNVGGGWGTALKPANEPICLARKPLSESTVAANVLKWGTGALNIDGCRIEALDSQLAEKYASIKTVSTRDNSIFGTDERARSDCRIEPHVLGRWPANVIHDGSDEVVWAFPESSITGKRSGSAARFFYSAKASKADRAGSKHPTVKPINLKQYLVRLITPSGGVVLDPFAGTGTTGEAAWREGMQAVLIEREVEYQNDIRRRISLMTANTTNILPLFYDENIK